MPRPYNLNFFDKREQCQTRLSNAERRKNQWNLKFVIAALPRHS